MAYKLPSGSLIKVKVGYVDEGGNVATVDGDVAWDTSALSVATVERDPEDSMLAQVSSVGPIGTCQISATADANLGQGTRNLVTLLDLEIVAGEAVAGVITPQGEPQPIAPHPEQQGR